MSNEPDARARFIELMGRSDDAFALDEVCLTIARGEYDGLEVGPYLRRLDEMARELRPRLSPEESPERLVAELNAYLFGDQAFHGNEADYYDPRNSYLNDVLDRRTGIPITLSVVYMEIARRVRLRIEGIGLPGHFIVHSPDAAGELYVDPFARGAVLTVADCEERVRQLYGSALRFSPRLLQPATRREIVARILGNLKGAYLRRGDLARAIRWLEWTMAADPSRAEDLREKGLLRHRMGDLRGAIADLEQYLERQPSGTLADQTRNQLRQIEELWTRRN